MAALNQAKIINALEQIVTEGKDDFIFSFLLAYGFPKATIKRLKMGDRQRNIAQTAGDIAVTQKIYFHPLRKGESTQGALIKILALPLIPQHKIRFVLVTDFKTVLAYDAKVDDQTEFDFDDFKTNYEFFLPLTGQYEKAVAYSEHPADVKACEKMGRLYDCIRAINHYEQDDLHTLNVFLTRLLFCFFAEDSGIFPRTNQVTDAVKSLTKEDGSDLKDFFEKLFSALSLPDDAPDRKNLSATFRSFPYVNGGLFKEQSPIPKFNTKARRLLLDCGYMTWSDISPVIFGSMFQEVMDPEKRRMMGTHYTSEKNILKVVRPLFLDALHEEFQQLLEMKSGKKKAQALRDFQTKLSILGFLDPACGCGNFLVVSYRELRELELKVLLAIKKEEPPKTLVLNVNLLSKVTINQFYGIEIEEFPVEIARVSMWLMEHVMNMKFGKAFGLVFPSIPLQNSAEIVCANALKVSWKKIVQPEKLNYILGNPPFGGARLMTGQQKYDLLKVFAGVAKAGNLDYVTAWYKKTADMMHGNTAIRAAFVSTNSICQGEQVAVLWKLLFNEYNIKIHFAYRTFKWVNEARGKAAVHCIIVGFGLDDDTYKIIYNSDGIAEHAEKINGYLIDADAVFVESRRKPLCSVPPIGIGNKPIDGGHYLFTAEEKTEFLRKEPQAEKWFRPWIGSDEFINGYLRYCIWLGDCSSEELHQMPEAVRRMEAVRQFRLASKSAPTRKLAETPRRFHVENMPTSNYLVIPEVSSERRSYIPFGFLTPNTLCSNKLRLMPSGTLYHFGIITSFIHMVWIKAVTGRLKSDFQYSINIVYNNFPWPVASEKQKKHIEQLAETILLTREMYPDMSLADMYDPDSMPEPLQLAHSALDVAVDRLYQSRPFASDEERLQLLFSMYKKLVSENPCDPAEPDEDEGGDDD